MRPGIYGIGDGGICPACDGNLDTYRYRESDYPEEYHCATCDRGWSVDWLTEEGRARYKRWQKAGGWRASKEAQRKALADQEDN